MRRKFGLLPRDESFFELFEQQAAVLRECLPILAAMCKTDIIDPHWRRPCRLSSSAAIS
jgi:hypothetical protein